MVIVAEPEKLKSCAVGCERENQQLGLLSLIITLKIKLLLSARYSIRLKHWVLLLGAIS